MQRLSTGCQLSVGELPCGRDVVIGAGWKEEGHYWYEQAGFGAPDRTSYDVPRSVGGGAGNKTGGVYPPPSIPKSYEQAAGRASSVWCARQDLNL